jgi:hypothetical protein
MDSNRRTEKDADPTLVRNQPALRTSSGRSWLVMGGLLLVVSLGVLVPMLSLGDSPAPWIGIGSAVVLYTAMVVVRLVVPAGRLRLGLMAACMGATAAISLICVAVVASTEWSLSTGID